MSNHQITTEEYQTTVKAVTKVWTDSKLFSVKADKQLCLIINSKATYATIINTRYTVNGVTNTIESMYGTNKQFAQDVTSVVMQNLLLAK